MVKLIKIGVLSFAKIYTVIMAILGFFLGLFFALINIFLSSLNDLNSPELAIYTTFGLWGIIFFPIIYGIIGFIAGLVSALIYNLSAKFVGGIELEFDKK